MKKIFYTLIFMLMLHGCALRHESIDKSENLILKDDGNLKGDFKKTDKILKIRKADTPLYLNSRAIIYVDRGFSNQYAYHFWADLPSNLYTSLLLAKFEKSEIFTTLLSQNSSLGANFVLESRINSFEQILNKDENYAYISISVNLIELEKNQIIAHKIFSVQEKIEKNNMPSLYNAFNKALNQLSKSIVFWVNAHL